MKKIIKPLISILFPIFLLSCATYSKKECESFNWDQRGYRSALRGEVKEDRLSYYYVTCNDKYAVKPEDQSFNTGYEKGLKRFCTADYAKEFARRGGEYVGTCTPEQEKSFLKPYAKGVNQFYKTRVYALERKVSDLESEVSSLESEKYRLQSELRISVA